MDNKNLHLTHIEESILDGKKQAIEALNLFKVMFDKFVLDESRPEYNIQYKVDGSPNIVFGINPENNQYFVGTKGVFNKNPKIYYSEKDIIENESNPNVSKILQQAFQYLKPVPGSKGVFSGDFMFSSDTVSEKVIEGKTYDIFKPNTIVYGLKTSPLEVFFNSYVFGMFIHTKYIGNKINELKASYKVNSTISTVAPFGYALENPSRIWLRMPTLYIPLGNFGGNILTNFDSRFKECNDLIWDNDENFLKYLNSQPQLKTYIKQFLNHLVKNNQSLLNEEKYYANDFHELLLFIGKDMTNKYDSYKTDSAKANCADAYMYWREQLTYPNVDKLFKTIDAFCKLKPFFLDPLNKVGPFEPFLETENGLVRTKAEGIVIQDTIHDCSYKIVNRLEFSRHNFANHA